MTRLAWQTNKYLDLDGHRIPSSENLADESGWQAGIRRESARSLRFKSIVWPAVKLRDDLFVDGFIEWVAGRWIREATNDNTSFLEIGCGDASLSRYLASNICYNAFDLSLSEFHLRRLFRRRPEANIAIASVTDIPLESNSVSLIVSTQVLEYVQRINRALDEIRRVATPGAKFICSIGNDFSRKYYSAKRRVYTPHRGHVNFWTYSGFIDFLAGYGFRLLEGQMRGVWIPLRSRLVHTSHALPIRAREEVDNSHFLFLFQLDK